MLNDYRFRKHVVHLEINLEFNGVKLQQVDQFVELSGVRGIEPFIYFIQAVQDLIKSGHSCKNRELLDQELKLQPFIGFILNNQLRNNTQLDLFRQAKRIFNDCLIDLNLNSSASESEDPGISMILSRTGRAFSSFLCFKSLAFSGASSSSPSSSSSRSVLPPFPSGSSSSSSSNSKSKDSASLIIKSSSLILLGVGSRRVVLVQRDLDFIGVVVVSGSTQNLELVLLLFVETQVTQFDQKRDLVVGLEFGLTKVVDELEFQRGVGSWLVFLSVLGQVRHFISSDSVVFSLISVVSDDLLCVFWVLVVLELFWVVVIFVVCVGQFEGTNFTLSVKSGDFVPTDTGET
ncbi:hypothetical protein WICPIJ_003383 [Wickerhamomyces pijperi]|uniref:Uncharacterized protein n=1 Tax=Wickerhamomyces pijperi TaxID=599730 RepID=A0A9P8TNR6_WICPI|nr:hypothetical protein WICPIJ_003383 [Wickerhamomyces pijperi]